MINDFGESLIEVVVAAGRTLVGVDGSSMSSMSAIDNGRGSCEISWGFGLDKGRRTSMEDAIAIVPEFLSPARWKDDGSEKEKPLVHYFGLFDGHGGPQVFFLVSLIS